MKPISQTRRVVYRLFAQVILLLLVYAVLALLGAVKFIGDDPLATSIPYSQVGAFANVMLNLAVMTGLLAGGVYIAADYTQSGSLANEHLLRYAFWLWTLLLVAAIFAGALGFLDGRHMLELPAALDFVQVIAAVLFVYAAVTTPARRSPTVIVWAAGIGLSIACSIVGLLPASNYLLDRVFRTLAVNLNLNVAYVLAGIALGFWLLLRFSSAREMWAEEGLYTTAGLLVLAGVLVSLPPLYPLGVSGGLGNIAVFFVPLAYLIFAAHSYRGFSDRNSSSTLAAHWYGLAVGLLFLGPGLLGALQTAPSISQWTQGTRLTDLQTAFTSLAILAVVLGMINQATAEIRGENRRITGLMPFWLVSMGVIGGGLALGGAGVVQVYLERVLSVGYLETQAFIVPLYVLWVLGALSMALGLLIYALGFWARRPELSV